MNRRISAAIISVPVITLSVLTGPKQVEAVTPAFWHVRTEAGFAAGDLDNISVDSRGAVTLSPSLEELADTGELYVWSLATDGSGTVFIGTGNDGKIFAMAEDGSLSPWCDLPDPDVLSLVVGERGELYAGTSGSGTVYRVEDDGDYSIYYETGAQYVWDLLRHDGAIFAATGDGASVIRIDAADAGSVLFDSPESHIMTLVASRAPGQLYAGSEGRGIVYEISLDSGRGFVLHEADEPEISTLTLGADGTLYVGATTGKGTGQDQAPVVDQIRSSQLVEELPSANGIVLEQADAVADVADREPAATPQGTQGPSHKPPTGSSQAHWRSAGGSTLYAVAPDGVVSQIWHAATTILALAAAGDAVLVGTGDQGWLHKVDGQGEHHATLAKSSASELTTILSMGEHFLVGSANGGGVLELGSGHARKGTVDSAPHDALSWSQWGQLVWSGEQPAGTSLKLYTRSGNSSSPDSTWSEWSAADGDLRGGGIESPNARFLQWRAELASSNGKRTPRLRSVSVAYQQRNRKPELGAISLGQSHAPQGNKEAGLNRTTQSSSRGGQPVAPDPTNPLNPVTGEWQVRWQVRDANGDELRHDLFLREFDGDESTPWKVIAEDLEAASHTFDSRALPDGFYVLRVVTSDERSNPAASVLSSEKISEPFAIDNTNPHVASMKTDRKKGVLRVTGIAEDATGPLWRGQYAINGGEWQPFFPSDGIFDEPHEAFEFSVDISEGGAYSLVLRVRDLAGNVGVRRTALD